MHRPATTRRTRCRPARRPTARAAAPIATAVRASNGRSSPKACGPTPPDLTKIVKEREPRHLFWVVKNGINMTGMPSFGATGMEDPEIWSVVAFLKKLPDVKEEDFKKWVQ